jgi:amino acid adenylation domain-containing protein
MSTNSVSSLKVTLEGSRQADTTHAIESIQAPQSVSLAKSDRTLPGEEKLPVLQLPSDFPKTPSTPYQAGYQVVYFSDSLMQSLNCCVDAAALEVRSLLLAAFSALLYRYTQQTDIHLGINIIRGTEPVALKYLGVPLHSELNGRALAQQVSATLHPIGQNGKPFSQAPQQPLPIIVSCLEEVTAVEDAKQIMLEFRQQHIQFPADLELHLALLQQPDGITGVLEYNTHLFTPDTIKRLLDHWQTLLEGMVKQLDCPIAQLPFLTPSEHHQLLVEWSSATVEYPQIPVHQHIEAHAAARPDAIALKFKDQQLTYGELNQRANQLAHYLMQVGVTAGERVAVCTQPSLESIVSLLAIFKVGGAYVPLDATHPMARLTTILEDTQANVLLTQAVLRPNLPSMTEHTLCLDQDWDKIQSFPAQTPEVETDLDQTAYIIYTSGTTGKPKGVMASYRNLINYILATQERFGFNQDDVMPAVARFTFSIAIFELLSPLAAGGTLFLLEREHILDFKRMAHTLEQLTMLHTVPSLMQKLLAYIAENELDTQKYQGIKYVFTGGDIVAPDLLEAMRKVFRNAQVYVLYGCSEVSSLCANYAVPLDEPVTKSRIGKPFNNVSIRVYDPDQNLVPIGVPGEIYVGGAGVTQGYLHRDDLTQEKFVTIDGQRFYRTGDLGRFRADGNVEFLGRADFQVKLRGIRIELGDIETALRQAPGVREGVVTACELGNRDEKSLVAYVVLDQSQNPTIGEIRQFLQSKLPDYMVPAGFVVLDALPLNPNQKVDRRALPLPTAENLAGLESIVPARHPSDQRLIDIWQALLGVQPIGIRNNFFELGGNSLLAVQMLTEVEKHWGKPLSITTLLHAATVEALVDLLESNEAAEGTGDLVPLRATGSKPPLFCIYGILLYQPLVNRLDPDQPVYGVYLQEEVELIRTGQFDQFNSVFATVPTIAARYLEAIRAFCPHGPYYLAGESFGGVVAYEMAQQLQAAGEEVALVALFDSWMTSSGGAETPMTRRVMQHIQLLSERGLSYLTQRVQRRTEIIRRKILSNLPWVYKKANSSAASVSQALSETVQKDIRAEVQSRASQAYTPKPYAGRLVLFRAMQREAFEYANSYDMGWGPLAANGLDIFEVPGDHLGILKEPNVPVLAEKLQSYLG